MWDKRELASRLRRLSAFLICCFTAANAHGAPLRLRFEATVTHLFTEEFDPGFEIDLGDSLSGRFSFEPFASATHKFLETRQQFQFAIDINRGVLDSSAFLMSAQAETGIADIPNVREILRLSGGNATPASAVVDGEPLTWSFNMQLWGSGDVLAVSEFPANPDVWNELQRERSIVVGIRDSNDNSVVFQALISSFHLVPEPSAAVLALMVIGIGLSRRVARVL